jgi:predicted nucleic acid-binding protein
VTGVKVDDARLVAVMTVYCIKSVLTFDTGDFAPYTHVAVPHPSQV